MEQHINRKHIKPRFTIKSPLYIITVIQLMFSVVYNKITNIFKQTTESCTRRENTNDYDILSLTLNIINVIKTN